MSIAKTVQHPEAISILDSFTGGTDWGYESLKQIDHDDPPYIFYVKAEKVLRPSWYGLVYKARTSDETISELAIPTCQIVKTVLKATVLQRGIYIIVEVNGCCFGFGAGFSEYDLLSGTQVVYPHTSGGPYVVEHTVLSLDKFVELPGAICDPTRTEDFANAA